jgi:hypothetical protein
MQEFDRIARKRQTRLVVENTTARPPIESEAGRTRLCPRVAALKRCAEPRAAPTACSPGAH